MFRQDNITKLEKSKNLKINSGPPPSRYFFDLPSLNLDHLGDNKTAMGPPLWTYPFFHYWQLIEIFFSLVIIFFLHYCINLFTSNYWLLFEAMMAVHPMGVGVSISSPLDSGTWQSSLTQWVSGPGCLTSWGLANRNAQIRLWSNTNDPFSCYYLN